MSRNPKLSPRHAAGFSMVEIMVGLVIGMLAMIIMMQVFALSEERKRGATGGGDAQSNGAISFYELQRHIGQSGYGLAALGLFNCDMTWPGASAAIPLAPVTINPAAIPAGDADTDTLLIVYGNGNGQPEGNVMTASGTVYAVQMPSSFARNDRVIAAPGVCSSSLILDTISADPGVGSVTVATGAAGSSALYNMGPEPLALAYAVRGGSLTVCDFLLHDCTADADKGNRSIWVPIAANVVSLRAVYGRDTSTPMDGIAELPGDQITPGSASDTSGIAPNCGWARVSAISLALVVRSSQYDKAVVTTTARNSAAPNAPAWAAASAPIILGADAAADEPWKHYRYKLFQSVVPIRNVLWMGVPTGC